jgi:hypothetical protein
MNPGRIIRAPDLRSAPWQTRADVKPGLRYSSTAGQNVRILMYFLREILINSTIPRRVRRAHRKQQARD